ncbi:UvrB/UvrC motif-containing protein [Veillonella caviae]|uniref:UvrB/UvrC motif-containing protein n=1 Tax=Veillonella caviae TaxID=248316 RepID=UPI0023F97593|nr:UvrB/UvrC motif-containing protein [Veillonella caviae]
MKCDHCKENEATVHMTNIVNNKKTEQHLCSTCASELQQNGGLSPFSSFVNDMWDNSFFTNEFFTNMVYPNHLLQVQNQQRCPHCGNTFEDFNRFGRFGCAHCYDTFEDQIESLVQRIQGSSNYEGKAPSKSSNIFKAQYEIKQLRHQLELAIQEEQFEEAARLRDKIKELELIISNSKD